MNDQIKNAEESFQIIKDMIENEKARFNENGFVYLFWGWLAIFCATLEYVLIFSEVHQCSMSIYCYLLKYSKIPKKDLYTSPLLISI